MIQLAFKTGKKLDCKIPFRNTGQLAVNIETGFLVAVPEEFPYEITLTTLNPSVQANSQFFINLALKSKFAQQRCGETRQVLVVKCKNSSLYFGFAVLISVSE